MKALKGVLIGLVITLVVIVAAGGALIGFNHEGHQASDSENVASHDQNTSSKQAQVKEHSAANGEKETNKTVQEKVVIAKEQISPEEYLKKIQEAQNLIKEATGLITNETGGTGTPAGTDTNNSHSMDNLHKGIYKMAQGMTLMDIAVSEMDKEIKNAKDANSFYLTPPSSSYYYYTNPYGNWVSPNLYGPYNYNNPNINNNQNNSNTDINGANNHNVSQNDSSAHNAHGSTTGNLFSGQNLIYLVYGFLFLSLIGVFVAIAGFFSSLFKPTTSKSNEVK